MEFVQAYKRLEEIYLFLQSSKVIAIDEILAMQEEAQKLHALCNEKLLKAEAHLDTTQQANEK